MTPIEQAFSDAVQRLTGVVPHSQVRIGKYRVDFLMPGPVVVECDGHQWHAPKWKRMADAQRDRFLTLNGYRVVRFTGSELHRDADACARETWAICMARLQEYITP